MRGEGIFEIKREKKTENREVATPNGATTVTLVVEDDDDDIEFVPNDGELTGYALQSAFCDQVNLVGWKKKITE